MRNSIQDCAGRRPISLSLAKGFAAVLLIFAVLLAGGCAEETPSEKDDYAAITRLLDEFLSGASIGDPAVHDRFWSEDLIYTSSSGERFGKERIMEGLRASGDGQTQPAGPRTEYTSEYVTVRLYGDMAVLTFRLVGTTWSNGPEEGTPEVLQRQQFLNSGTLRREEGVWKVINWQATREAEPAGE